MGSEIWHLFQVWRFHVYLKSTTYSLEPIWKFHNLLTDHCSTTSYRCFRSIVEIIDTFSAHEFEFKMGVWVNPTRQHVFAPGVNHPGSSWNYEILPDLLDDAIFNVNVVVDNLLITDHFAIFDQ